MDRNQKIKYELSLESTKNRRPWVDWKRILSEYSYLYLVGSISATSLEPILGSLMCLVLAMIFHLQTYPEGKKIFGRLWDLRKDLKRQRKKYKKDEKFNEHYLKQNKKLLKIEQKLGRNKLDSPSLIYFISSITSLVLLIYNISRL